MARDRMQLSAVRAVQVDRHADDRDVRDGEANSDPATKSEPVGRKSSREFNRQLPVMSDAHAPSVRKMKAYRV